MPPFAVCEQYPGAFVHRDEEMHNTADGHIVDHQVAQFSVDKYTYALGDPAPVWGPGETTTVTLNVGRGVPLDSKARVSVEGYIGDELVGGIPFEQVVPAASVRAVYLPLVIRSQD
jgi:hypothetical protein